jgi:hypothetical protein
MHTKYMSKIAIHIESYLSMHTNNKKNKYAQIKQIRIFTC